MNYKRILTPLIIILLLLSMVVMGAPTYVNIGSTTEFEGDVGIPVGSDYYIGNDNLNLDDLVSGWNFTHLEDQLFFGELAGIANVKHSKFDATTSPTVNDDVDLEYVVGSHWVDITNDKEYICLDNTDGAAVWTETTQVAGGYTNLTSFVEQTAWRVFYSDSLGDIIELALGANGTYLKSGGAAVAPTWSTPAGAGDVVKVGTPANSQIGVWTGDGTIEGAASLTYDGANLQLTGDIGSTGTKITKGWFTDLLVTNAIAGSITGNTVTFTCTDNENEALNCPLVFVDGATGAQGAETDGDLTYNPSTGKITATGFVGALTGNADTVTGFTPASGSLILAGADALTITTSAATGVTLPTTGTLMANLEEDTDPDLGGQMQAGAHSINFTEQVLTSGTAIAWNLGNSNKAILTAAHNFTITITAPSGALNAQLIVTQDGTGTRVMDEIVTQSDATIATTDVHTDTEIIDITIDIPTGARIRFDNDVGTDVPLPLVEDTIYYAIRSDATHIQVATTKANAHAGTNIDITDTGTNTHTVEQLVKWTGGTLGVLSTAAGSEDILGLTYKTADKQWYAQVSKDFQ